MGGVGLGHVFEEFRVLRGCMSRQQLMGGAEPEDRDPGRGLGVKVLLVNVRFLLV